MKTIKMKAYEVRDVGGNSGNTLIIFAETRGKAMRIALGTDAFPKYEYSFTDLRAVRIPELDMAYCGETFMDWGNDEDRLILVRDAGYHCDEEIFDPCECEQCAGKHYCKMYEGSGEEE